MDPVVTEHGFAYERSALREYDSSMIRKKMDCIDPVTRKATSGRHIRCFTLKTAIDQFLEDNPWGFEFAIKDRR
jgi:hypothetical protein